MCNRVLLLFGELPQGNLHVNCHVNGTKFQSGLRFQTGLSSLRVSCKRALKFASWKVDVGISQEITLWKIIEIIDYKIPFKTLKVKIWTNNRVYTLQKYKTFQLSRVYFDNNSLNLVPFKNLIFQTKWFCMYIPTPNLHRTHFVWVYSQRRTPEIQIKFHNLNLCLRVSLSERKSARVD